MPRKKKSGACCDPSAAVGCCKVESLISIDERGQMVLPKELRDKAGIRAGDKLVVVSWEQAGKICCVSFIKNHEFAQMVKGFLGPMMKEMAKDEDGTDKSQ